MKKLLALVLALVMTLGLATVGANAAYKDADDINYKEAVDVMSAIGVLAGDETGFRPTDTLKRSEGAKIIAYLIAGNATADAMTATGTKYTDLPANHWAAGYMEYLSAIGVMGGLGDGRIDPDGSLTATAFAKMLLVALGYDATLENFGGPDWQINVQRVANKNSLFDGNSSVVGSAAVTREEAALYALNALKAPLVEYETKGTQINVGDASITTGASNATYMTTTDSTARYRNIANNRVNGTGEQIVEFAEQYYDGLKLADGGTDGFGRPANVWTLKGKEVGTYTKGSDLQYTAAVKMGKIYTDLGLTSTIEPADITIKEDGIVANNNEVINGEVPNSKSHATWTNLRLVKGSTSEIGGNGALTEVYFDDDNNTVEIFVTNTYFAKVEAAYAATSSKDAYVTLGTIANETNTGIGTTYDTDAFKAGDYVLYTYSYAGNGSVESMELATAVQGKLSAYQVGTNVTVDGAVIKSNTVAASKATINEGLQNAIDTTVTVFKDKNDYAVAVDATAASDAYAVVLGWTGNDSVGKSTRSVNLLFADGSKKSVTANGIYDRDGEVLDVQADDTAAGNIDDDSLNIGDIVSYRVNSKGEYKLTLLADTQKVATGTTITTKNTSALGVTLNTSLNKANGKTVFALYNSTSGAVNIYEGIANVPTVLTKDSNHRATAYQKTGTATGYADFVWIDVVSADVTNSNKDVIFIKGGSGDAKYDATYGTYYEYDAVINDEITKIKLDGAVTKYTIATDIAKDSDNIYDVATKKVYADTDGSTKGNGVVYYAKGTDAAKNGTILFGGSSGDYYSVAKNPKVFRIDTAGTITESTLGAIQKDSNDQVFWKMTDGLATTIIVRTVDDTVTTGSNVAASSGNSSIGNGASSLGKAAYATNAAFENDGTGTDIVVRYPDGTVPSTSEIRNAVAALTGKTITGYKANVATASDGTAYAVGIQAVNVITIDGKIVAEYDQGTDLTGETLTAAADTYYMLDNGTTKHVTIDPEQLLDMTTAKTILSDGDGKLTLAGATTAINNDYNLLTGYAIGVGANLTDIRYTKTASFDTDITDGDVVAKGTELKATASNAANTFVQFVDGDGAELQAVGTVQGAGEATYTFTASENVTVDAVDKYLVKVNGANGQYLEAGDKVILTAGVTNAQWANKEDADKGGKVLKAKVDAITGHLNYAGGETTAVYTVADTDQSANGIIDLVQTFDIAVTTGITTIGTQITYDLDGDATGVATIGTASWIVGTQLTITADGSVTGAIEFNGTDITTGNGGADIDFTSDPMTCKFTPNGSAVKYTFGADDD